MKAILTYATLLTLALNAGAVERQWVFNQPLGAIDSSPAVADLTGDGKPEVIATTVAGCVLALDGDGKLLWNANLKIPFSISPTVVDLLEDETPEVLALNQVGTLFCLSGKNGAQIWSFQLPGDIEWGTTAIAVSDLDGDNTPEIVTGTKQGQVVCISAQGSQKWVYQGEHGFTLSPAIGALGPDTPKSILIAGTKLPLVCLDAQGKEQWRVKDTAKGAAPIIVDLDSDGNMEILTGYDNAVMAVNGDGSVRWKLALTKETDSSLCVADADEDGIIEIYAIDLSGKLYAVSPIGQELWRADVVQRARRNPAIADIDGDEAIEIVVGGYDSQLHVFNAKGEPKETLPMGGTTNAAPVIACFGGDGRPSVLYASNMTELIALQWPDSKPAAKLAWDDYRYDAARTGCYLPASAQSKVSVSRVEFGDFYVGQNKACILIQNDANAMLHIETTVDTGETQTTTTDNNDNGFLVTTEYTIPAQQPCNITIRFDVYEGNTLVARRSQRNYIVPFAKELKDYATLLKKAESYAKVFPNPWMHLGRLAALRAQLDTYKDTAAIVGTVSAVEARELRDALRSDLTELERTIKLLYNARSFTRSNEQNNPQCSTGMLKCTNPWIPFTRLDEYLYLHYCENVLVFAFQGETEDAAINFANFDEQSTQVRIEIPPLSQKDVPDIAPVPAFDVIRLHEVISVPTQSLDLSADALPRMNTGRIFTLPAWDARQLWLTIDTSSLAPGVWSTTVEARTLEVESRTFSIPLEITVSKHALPKPLPLHHCNWGYTYSTPRMQALEDAALVDRVAHGEDVFVSSLIPQATYDADGALVGAIDFAKHDDFVKRYSPHGMILFQSYGGLTGPAPIDTPAGKRAYVAWLRAWVEHLNALGLGYDQYAMYPIDEPGLNEGLVKAYLDFAKCAREADPNIRMYTDPVERIRAEELTEMLPYVDIWCPNRDGFFLGRNEDKLAIIQNSGKPVWMYACADNAKHQSPLGYYRAQSWEAYRFHLEGIGFWSYCTSSADPWYRPDGTLDYLLVYPGDDVVVSKRWEAVRDGMEDYAMLKHLEAAKDKAKAENRAPESVAAAEKLLNEDVARIGDFNGRDNDGTTPGADGLEGVRTVEDHRYRDIQDCRRQIDALLTALGE